VKETRRNLLQNLGRFKESLAKGVGKSSKKPGSSEYLGEEMVQGMLEGPGRYRQVPREVWGRTIAGGPS
jgi:hypothetical protein